MPTVSVVIPSLGRPELQHALRSLRDQSEPVSQVLVVLDDPTQENQTRALMQTGERLLVTRGGVGGGEARRLGAQLASSEYVAFLDDDDWWEPGKNEVQLRATRGANADWSFTGSFFHESSGGVRMLPRIPPPSVRELPDYVISRPRLTFGDGFVQTSSLLLKAEVAEQFAWDSSLRKHQDWDLILRLAEAERTFAYCERPLVNVRQGSVNSVSRGNAWQLSKFWYERHKGSLGTRARGDFVATQTLRSSLATGEWRGIRWSLEELLKTRPHLAALLVGLSGAPQGIRHVISNRGLGPVTTDERG